MEGFQFPDGKIWIPVYRSSQLHRITSGRRQNYYTENCVKFCVKEKHENLLLVQ